AVDDDARMLADQAHGAPGDGLLPGRGGRGGLLGDQPLGQGHGTAIATQEQPGPLQHRQILADGPSGGRDRPGQRLDPHPALVGKEGQDGVSTLQGVAFGEGHVSIRKITGANQNIVERNEASTACTEKRRPTNRPPAYHRFFCGRFQPSILRCLPRPTARVWAGTSWVMVDPAPVVAPAPRFSGATSELLEPMNTSSPITVRCLLAPS